MGNDADPVQGCQSWIAQVDSATALSLGRSLRHIDPGLMKDIASEGNRIWYQGKEPYFDLVVETDGTGVQWFQITLRGRVLFWSRQTRRLQTGETEELDVPPLLAYYPASKGIRDGAQLDGDFVRLVAQILKAQPENNLFQSMVDILEAA